MLVSIVVPVYNVEQYLSRCIESLLDQSYSNIEIILVDDGSTDRCGSICDNYQLIDSRIKVFHKVNGGLSSARNCGIKHVNGQYTMFVDSDDFLDVDCIKKILRKINKSTEVVIFPYIKEYKNKSKKVHIFKEKNLNFSEKKIRIIYYLF
ncbi:glycosyltransferase family 2 protein [Candidatus Stoquefichus massiliensis]|uniref:glycosyltransferase family 2 protein n=1 Tax=Candidatus Stoquefichus massiliensis TaxID=1470350 RepID=UPI0004B265AE|nr:glycosyltransferase family 2 protein [Candidatus Stoquefichus massiliensis]